MIILGNPSNSPTLTITTLIVQGSLELYMIGLFSRAFHFVWRDAPCMSYTTAASRKSLHRVKHSNMYWIGFVLILALITIPPGSLGNLAAKRYRSTCDTNPSDLHLTKGNF